MMPGNMSSMSRPVTGAGSTLQRGQGVRGSIDDLALMVAGAPPAQGAFQAQQPAAVAPSYPGYPQQLSQYQQQQQFLPQQQQQFQPPQYQQQQSYADQSEETEIM